MRRIDQSSARCLVFTFKEGLLSKVAHDLKLEVGRFSVDIDEEALAVTADFEPGSLRVVDAVVDGREDPGVLSSGDRQKIGKNLVADVLHPRKHPRLRFESRAVERIDGRVRITGMLDMHGRSRELRLDVIESDASWMVTATLHQPDWGIKPYSAMLGTLRVKSDVRVELVVPRD